MNLPFIFQHLRPVWLHGPCDPQMFLSSSTTSAARWDLTPDVAGYPIDPPILVITSYCDHWTMAGSEFSKSPGSRHSKSSLHEVAQRDLFSKGYQDAPCYQVAPSDAILFWSQPSIEQKI